MGNGRGESHRSAPVCSSHRGPGCCGWRGEARDGRPPAPLAASGLASRRSLRAGSAAHAQTQSYNALPSHFDGWDPGFSRDQVSSRNLGRSARAAGRPASAGAPGRLESHEGPAQLWRAACSVPA
eukprot:9553746-Alexandrium_andersonii.AAC.1